MKEIKNSMEEMNRSKRKGREGSRNERSEIVSTIGKKERDRKNEEEVDVTRCRAELSIL